MIKEAIEQILEDELFATGLSTREDWKARVGGKSVAARRIVELIERRPVDKVRAMAALVGYNDYRSSEYTSAYNVPGENGEMFMVRFFSHKGERWVYCRNAKSYEICCSTNRTCDHIQAVEHHLAAAQEGK